ncbi:MAG: hypothetical protein C0483_18665 [Pirellula sp.]|nr:hypothetical protein [Pirellula sp.]
MLRFRLHAWQNEPSSFLTLPQVAQRPSPGAKTSGGGMKFVVGCKASDINHALQMKKGGGPSPFRSAARSARRPNTPDT